MLLNNTEVREFDGNLEGETISVGIADIRLIIDRLTDMYSDREMAVIREYSCNALDAHIEAGVTSPIEVTTPGPLEPFLTIRDFGVGLTVDDIREIYSQYGASTKRNTNTQTGAFGLGCKSGLAYADQFTVTSVKDGVRIQVVVSRDPAKGITMKVVDTSNTSDPNGTTVMIPARGYNDFERKAKAFFANWKRGTVKLNGAMPEFMPGARWVTDSICINSSSSSQSYVVMGGVPYPVSIDVGMGYYTGITAFVAIGSVEPSPARESLIDSDLTTSTLKEIKSAFRQGLHAAIVRDVQNASSHADAATKKREWAKQIGTTNMPSHSLLRYKGQEVPDSFETETDTIAAPLWGSKMSSHSTYPKGRHIPLANVNSTLWVTGFDYASFTATVKKKLNKYVEDNGLQVNGSYFLTASTQKPDTTWLENVTFVDWPTIKAIKLPKAARSNLTGRIPGSYDIFESGDLNMDVPADDIDASNPIFWMIGKHYSGQLTASWLNEKFPGCTLVMMRDGRQTKFQRLFPTAKDAQSAIRDGFKAWVDGIDKDDALAVQMRQEADSRLAKLDETLLDDPAIKAAKAVINRDLTAFDAEDKAWKRLGFYYSPDEDQNIHNPLDAYLMLPDSYYLGRYMRDPSGVEAIYRYMNAEYAWRKEQS